jgi:hypothetical protein
MKFVIDKDGTVNAVYSDEIKKMNLGRFEVARASNVEFNVETQEWEARTPAGVLIAKGPSRDQVIRDEVAVIEAQL